MPDGKIAKNRHFIPKLGDKYYYVGIDGNPIHKEFSEELLDEMNCYLGNCFRSRGTAVADSAEMLKRINEVGKTLRRNELR
jgi:hypothetical protein